MRIRDWTVKEIVQGKPWAHPTHAMFVHFPTALFPAAFVFGVLSLVQESKQTAQAAVILIGLGIAGSIPAVVTGLVDWLGMVPRSTKRGVATKHMLYQAAAQVVAVVAFALHLIDRSGPAPVLGVMLLAGSVTVMFAGNWLGGVLVYRMAMRVGGSREPTSRPSLVPGEPTEPARR